ncbi:hypothetical protein ES703_43743 [subsurface metagenome]
MDEIDFIILKKLMENSRVTYRELAEIINMSVSSTYKGINKLVDDEVIEAFTARPSAIALNYLSVIIHGTSKAKSMDLLSKELGQHESIKFIAITGGKFLYIGGYLRDLSELQDFSVYVSKTAQMNEPTIGIINIPYITPPESLTSIDYKILKSLNKDSRMPITDIADDVGLSAKTVRKRLDRMIKNNLILFTLELSVMKVFSTGFNLYLKEGTNIASTMQYLYEKYSKNISYCYSCSNIPNYIAMHTWTKNAQGSQKIQEELQTEGFQDVIPHIFLTSKFYDCWIDQLLRTK